MMGIEGEVFGIVVLSMAAGFIALFLLLTGSLKENEVSPMFTAIGVISLIVFVVLYCNRLLFLIKAGDDYGSFKYIRFRKTSCCNFSDPHGLFNQHRDRPGFCTEKETSTLEAVEVKDETDAGPAEIPLSDVQKSREVTRERVYGLIALWAIIALCVYLVNLQRKDDEKLYQDGYYNREDE